MWGGVVDIAIYSCLDDGYVDGRGERVRFDKCGRFYTVNKGEWTGGFDVHSNAPPPRQWKNVECRTSYKSRRFS